MNRDLRVIHAAPMLLVQANAATIDENLTRRGAIVTYRDLVRRSGHPYAGGEVGHVTSPAPGQLPEPRTQVDPYAPGPQPALPYASGPPHRTADGTDWAIREWAVRVWAARDHGSAHHRGEPRSSADDVLRPSGPGDVEPAPLDWDALDTDGLDAHHRDTRHRDSHADSWLAADPPPHTASGDDATDRANPLDDLADLIDADDETIDPPASAAAAPMYRRPAVPADVAPGPAGPPPPRLYAAAILTAVLSLPLLLSAGVFVAVSTGAGFTAVVALFLAVVAVAGAAGDVVGALRLADRGNPRLARVGGYTTLAGAVLSAGWLLLGGGAATVLFPIWASFGVVAIVMFALLGSAPCRDWLAAREWEQRAAGTDRRR